MLQFTIFAKHLKEPLDSGDRFPETDCSEMLLNSIDYKLRQFDQHLT